MKRVLLVYAPLLALCAISGCRYPAQSPLTRVSRPDSQRQSSSGISFDAQQLPPPPTVEEVTQLMREYEISVPESITVSSPEQRIEHLPDSRSMYRLDSLIATSHPRLLYFVYSVSNLKPAHSGETTKNPFCVIAYDESDPVGRLRILQTGGPDYGTRDAEWDKVPSVAPGERRVVVIGTYFHLKVKWSGDAKCGVFFPQYRDDPNHHSPPPPEDSKLPIDKPLYDAELDEWFAKEFK